MTGARSPIRVAVVNDYELVVVGVAALLEPYRDRVEVVEVDSRLQVVSDVDIVLYDTFGQHQGERLDIRELSRNGRPKIVVFSWNLEQSTLESSIRRGASGYLSKGLAAKDMVEAIETVAAGGTVFPPETAARSRIPDSAPVGGAWPGQEAQLTARESEIVALITQGLSNQEIAERSYLSINSVKTYIRTAYRKMGVTRRSQAVLWGINHGFEPDNVRRVRDLN